MAISRDDRTVQDGQGRALAGAQVAYATQPANTSVFPPTPAATVYTGTGGTVGTNPVITDGLGHSVAYLQNSVLYTVAINHPLFSAPVILTDQAIGGGGSGVGYTPFEGVLLGTQNGTNTVFTLSNGGAALTAQPTQVAVAFNGVIQTPGLGYTLSGPTVTFAVAPQPTDNLYSRGLL